MIIDAHSHVHDPVQAHLVLMEEASIDRSILFATRPHPERAHDLAGIRREMQTLTAAMSGDAAARVGSGDGVEGAWRELTDALASHPDRFIGFRSLRLDQSPAETSNAVEADVVAAGYRGIGELTPPPNRAGVIESVLQAASDYPVLPVVVHGAVPTTEGDIGTLAGLARRYPRVPLVISQLGGMHWLTAIEAALETPNLYLELSTANIIFAIRVAITELPDRTLFGSDAPYGDPVLSRTAIERVTRAGAVRDQVLGGTIGQLLGL